MIFPALRQGLDASQLLRLFALVCALIAFNDIDSNDRLSTALKDWGHVVVFFLASAMVLHQFRYWIDRHHLRLTSLAALCLGIGAGIELIQPWFGRDRSLIDLTYDAVGISAAVLLYLANHRRTWTLRGIAITLLTLSVAIPATYGTMALARTFSVPYLAGFEYFWEQEIWRPNEHSSARIEPNPAGGHWLRVDMGIGPYPGVSLPEIHRDWRDYNTLALRVFSPQTQSLTLTLRIHDAQHNNDYDDRLNQRLSIQPGINDLVINLNDVASAPKNRRMDLSQIQSLMLFVVSPKQPLTVYVDEIRLLN